MFGASLLAALGIAGRYFGMDWDADDTKDKEGKEKDGQHVWVWQAVIPKEVLIREALSGMSCACVKNLCKCHVP